MYLFRRVEDFREKEEQTHFSWEEQSGSHFSKGFKESDLNKVKEAGALKKGGRKKKWIKAKRADYYYVLGEDIGWEQVSQMVSRTLVGRVVGRSFILKTVVAWVDVQWKDALGYVPEVVYLSKGPYPVGDASVLGC